MKIQPVIARIKAQAHAFSSRVAGAAEFEAAADQIDLAVPHAFVVPLAEIVEPNQTAGAVTQILVDVIGVIVAVSNTVDLRGQAGSEQLYDLRQELWDALLGWEPAAGMAGFEYDGAAHLDMVNARLWHQFDFVSKFCISEKLT